MYLAVWDSLGRVPDCIAGKKRSMRSRWDGWRLVVGTRGVERGRGELGLLGSVDLSKQIGLVQDWAGSHVKGREKVHLERVVEEAVVKAAVGKNVFLRLPIVAKELRVEAEPVLRARPGNLVDVDIAKLRVICIELAMLAATIPWPSPSFPSSRSFVSALS